MRGGTSIAAPITPLATLTPRSTSPSLLAQEGEGAREWWSTIVSAKPTIPTSPVCCPLWRGTTRQQGRWRHRADRGRLRPLLSARGIPCALDGGTRSSSQCEPMHRWSLLSVNAPRRHPVMHTSDRGGADRAGAILAWRRRRCSSTACSVAAVGQCSAPPSPKSGDDVARNPAHLELLIRLLLACRTRPERTTHG